MSSEEQKTLLDTIQARLERNESGSINFVADENGPWKIIKSFNSKHPLVTYFKPDYIQGFDQYGSPIEPKALPEPEK